MRTKALLIIIGAFLLVGLIGFFWGDSILAWSIEQTLQTVIGTKVDIEHFHLDPINLSVQIGSLKMTNPADTWKNLIDTKNIRFKLSADPLYEGKTVIDEIVVEDLTFNTVRKTNGKLSKQPLLPGPLGKAQAKLQQSIAKMPVLNPKTIVNNLDTDKLTASYQFKTDFSSAKVKTEINDYQNKWRANLKEIENMKMDLKSLDLKVAELKNFRSNNLIEIKEQLTTVKTTQDSVKELRKKIVSTDDRFKKDNQTLTEAISSLKKEAEDDYQSLLGLAKVPDLGSLNYVEALLGKTMLDASTIFLKMSDEMNKSLPVKVDNPPKEEHTRGGQEITFPGRKTFPRFLIKKIAISGKGTPDSFLDGFYAKGAVTGITNEPPIYGLPITADIFGKTANQAYLELKGQINHISPAFQDHIKLKLVKLPLLQLRFPESECLPSKLLSGDADIDADFQMDPRSMRLRVLITGNKIKSDFSNLQTPQDDLIAEVIRKTIADLDQITVEYRLERSDNQLNMKISSNLNDLISTRLNESIGAKIAGFTKELRAKVDAKLLENQKELTAEKLQFQQEVSTKLNDVQTQLSRYEQELQVKTEELQAKKKELETGIQQDLKNKLKLKF